jgi:protein arginine N-methyltransferase 7
MDSIPHRRLTRPKRVFEFFFDGSVKSTAQEGLLKLEPVADGYLNAVCFWFDLHLDEEATISTAPAGVGKGGELHADSAQAAEAAAGSTQLVAATNGGSSAAGSGGGHYWGQALQYLERATQVRPQPAGA